eukprot:9046141-Pyramimonas_sp.AAC.1
MSLQYYVSPPDPPWGRATAPYQRWRPSFWGLKPTKTYGKSAHSASWASWDSKTASRWPQNGPKT